MVLPIPGYGLVESQDYLNELGKIGDCKRLDDALRGVTWALSRNPKVYEVVEGTKDVRLLKTDSFGDLPELMIWFRIDEVDERVELLMIESVQEEDDGAD